MLNFPNHDMAVIAAAQLAFDHAWRNAFASNATPHSISAALVPLFGISWTKKVITAVKTNRINDLLAKIRNVDIPRADYDKLADLFKLAFFAPTHFLPEWEEWRVIAERYRLDRRHSWLELASVVSQFISAGINSPFELAGLEAPAVESMVTSFDHRLSARDFWRATRLNATKASPADHLFLATQDVDVREFRRAIKRHKNELSRDPRDTPLASSSHIRLPKQYERLGPMARIKTLRESGQAVARVGRFIQDRTQANLLKQVRGSLPAISSALNCFSAFCDLRDTRPFPVSERIVIEWSAVFSDSATFANYISHLQKACFFIGSPTVWLTPAVRLVAKGLKKCHDSSFKFPNFIQSRLLLRIVRLETAQSEFSQACWLSFLFAFRVPSETLLLQRAFRNDDIAAFTPQREKALIGVRTDPEGSFLIVKMKWRKNLDCGCVMRRPCFCTAGSALATAFCPVHILWPAIRSRVPSGGHLFSAVNTRNFNRILRAVLRKLKVPEAERYSSHGFRRGTAQDLKLHGSPWEVVASAGIWNSSAFRGYLDLTAEVEQGVRNLFAVDPDSDSA